MAPDPGPCSWTQKGKAGGGGQDGWGKPRIARLGEERCYSDRGGEKSGQNSFCESSGNCQSRAGVLTLLTAGWDLTFRRGGTQCLWK